MDFKIVAGIVLLLALANLLLSFTRFQLVRRIATIVAIAAVLASAVSGVLMPKIYSMQSATPISVRALDQKHTDAEGTEIWIVGAEVDGVFYKPDKLFSSGWIQKDGQIGWRNYDQPAGLTPEVTGKLPIGQERYVLLDANKWRGMAEITIDGTSQSIDCYLPLEQNDSLKVSLPPAVATDEMTSKNMRYLILGISFAVAVIGLSLLRPKKKTLLVAAVKEAGRDREIWSDLLRVVSAFAIVVIHATGGLYEQYAPTQQWYFGLYVNAITRFAVPCFMLLSGAYTIAFPQSIGSTWKKRIVRVLVPLLFWSVCYIFLHYGLGENISIKRQITLIPLQTQHNHLWFIYQLIGFYVLLPVLSQLYQMLTEKYKWYFISVTLLIPSLLDFILKIFMPDAPAFLNINRTYIGVPEIGLFFLGCILLDYLKKNLIKPLWAGVIAFVGFAGIVLSSYVVSVNLEQSFWRFFDQIRFPTVIFAVGVFALFYSMEKYMHKLPEQMKQAVRKMSQLSMGVYFVHCIPLTLISGGTTKKILVSFVVSYAFCYLLAQIPYLKKLVL